MKAIIMVLGALNAWAALFGIGNYVAARIEGNNGAAALGLTTALINTIIAVWLLKE